MRIAGEKPKIAPPRAAAGRLAPQRRRTQNMAAADPAKPSVSSVVRVACGPMSRVSGAKTTPGSRNEVFHIRLMPCGAFTAVVTRSGSRPCAIAVAS